MLHQASWPGSVFDWDLSSALIYHQIPLAYQMQRPQAVLDLRQVLSIVIIPVS